MCLLWDHPYIMSGKHWAFSDPATISINTIMNISKTGHFLNPPSCFADIIYGWSFYQLSQLRIRIV